MEDYIVEKRSPDGKFERINISLWCRIYGVKKKNNELLPEKLDLNHPMLGKSFILHGEVVTIKKVVKQWHGGYYYAGLYEDEDLSTGLVYFENINSIDPCVLRGIESFKENFRPL